MVHTGRQSGFLLDAVGGREAKVISVVGGGGKTSTIKRLAREFQALHREVVVTTTTRLAAGEGLSFAHRLLTRGLPAEEWLKSRVWACRDVLLVGAEIDGGKVKGIHPEEVDALHRSFPYKHVLVEADGSAKKPFKAPAEHEPVVPASTELVIVIVGAWAFGVPVLPEHVHRAQLVAAFAGVDLGVPLTAAVAARALLHPASYPKCLPEGAAMTVIVNGVDDVNGEEARRFARQLRQAGMQKVVLANVSQEPPIQEVIA